MFLLDGVSKSFDGVPVVHEVSLRVEPGETLVVIGPSGCGKSTLLRLMLGLLLPDGGRVLFSEEPVGGPSVRAVRRRVGYVIQDGGLFPHLTAERNITLMARRLGWGRERVASRLAELTSLTAFPTDRLTRYPIELSGGQRQRVALMRALMLDPDALLLDEPLGSLDPMVRYELQAELRSIFRRLGKTTVLVTHDLAEAEYFGDRIVLMRAGTIVQAGTAGELSAAPADAFVRSFLQAQRTRAGIAAAPAGEAG